MEGGTLQHALMTREQFWERTGTKSIANAELHIVLPDDVLLTTHLTDKGSAVFQQGVLIPHRVENVRKVEGARETVAFTFHPANPMVRRLDVFSIASTWSSRDMREDIGKLLLDFAEKRIDALIGALDLANGVEDISCPDDTFETPSVFDFRSTG